MATAQIDMSAKISAFPYVAPPGADVRDKAKKAQSDLDSFISDLQSIDIPSDISSLLKGGPTSSKVGQDEWNRSSLADMGPIGDLIEFLDGTLKTLDRAVNALAKIMKLISLFINTFTSFSKLIESAINLAQSKLNEYADTALQFGAFGNVIVPPGFLKGSEADPNEQNKSRGGFNAFLTRLDTSMKNTQDPNRPKFGYGDFVGGMVILLDSESLDDIWKGLKQLAGFFDFMKLFGLNLAPPPPTDINGYSGFFVDTTEPEAGEKFGIQLEWNTNYTTPAFNVYRSRVAGGVTEEVPYVPTSLVSNKETGEEGLLRVATRKIGAIKRGEPFVQPTQDEQVWNDPDFNGGEPVLIENTGRNKIEFVDQYINTRKEIVFANDTDDDGTAIEIPFYYDQDGKEVPVYNYYYMIRSCTSSGKIEGPNSKELSVAVKTCNDNFEVADLQTHPNGQVEFFAVGAGKINSWSSIRIGTMIPWFTDIVKILNGLLNSMKGMVSDASDSFSKFLEQIQEKVRVYTDLLKTVAWIITMFKNFLLGTSIAFLNLDPALGGNKVFMDRVRAAQPPDGESFSGPNGVSIGIVLMYGAPASAIGPLLAIKKAFELIYSLFVEE